MQKNFQSSTIIEAGISDFHNLTVTVLKSYFKKLEELRNILRFDSLRVEPIFSICLS